MATLEQRIAALEQAHQPASGITTITRLIIDPTEGLIRAFRRTAPDWQSIEVTGVEFEALQAQHRSA